MKNFLIVEFSASHSELIFSQILFLEKYGCKIHLFINHYSPFKALSSAIITKTNPDWSRIRLYRELLRYVQKEKIDTIIFNTAEGLIVRDLIPFLLFKKIKAAGILHHAEKAVKSFTQKIISLKVRKYFVLNDYVLVWLKNNYKGDNLKFESFYPIYFQEAFAKTPVKSDDDFIVCLPGAVEPERKDYKTLINILAENKINLNPKIKFQILGNSSGKEGGKIKQLINEKNLDEIFITYNNFIDDEEFYQSIKSSSIILPLIHPSGKYFNSFLETGISGVFNLALGFRKPMLLHESFRIHPDYRDVSLFYSEKDFISKLNYISSSASELEKLEMGYDSLKKLDFSVQASKYFNFLSV
ncbi:MAG: hypothetical protein HXY49_03880 [Ignavibacteriaceae bacterium]|nr:hypothetical protein [Ignavibacteriaceae bacterium]